MDKGNFEWIMEKYVDAEKSLFELRNALRGYDDVDAQNIDNIHTQLNDMLVSFHNYYSKICQ